MSSPPCLRFPESSGFTKGVHQLRGRPFHEVASLELLDAGLQGSTQRVQAFMTLTKGAVQ